MTKIAAGWCGVALAVVGVAALGIYLMRKREAEAANTRAVEAELRGYASGFDDGVERAGLRAPAFGGSPRLRCVK